MNGNPKMNSQGRGKFRGGVLKKEMKTYKMPMQNKPIYDNSSKLDNGKVSKYSGKLFWEAKFHRGGGILKKK